MIFGKHMNRYYLKYAWMLFIGVIALVVVDLAQLKIPEFYRTMVNGLNGSLPVFDLDFLLDEICKPMIFIVLVIVAGRFTWRYTLFGAAIKVESDLRDEMFDHCKDLSSQYYQTHKVGDLMSLFTNDLETVQDCFGSGALMFFDALLLGSMVLFKMFRMSVSLTVCCLIPISLIFTLSMNVSRVMNKRWAIRQAAFSSLSDFAQESYSGIAVVKAFAGELREIFAFRKLNQKNEAVNIDYTRVATFMMVLITLSVESIVCVILGYGGYLVHEKIFDPGMLVEFIGYFTSIVWPVMAIARLVEMSAKGKASLGRISALLDADIDVRDRFAEEFITQGESVSSVKSSSDSAKTSDYSNNKEEKPALSGEIEFRHLSFTYPGSDLETLHDLSFHINAGDSVGILGRTGAGKTTLVDLIARIYNVEDATLFVDGKDVNTIPIRDIRSNIAYVPQDNFLFSDTIEQNIAFSLPLEEGLTAKAVQRKKAKDVSKNDERQTDPRVIAAARLSDVHDNIMEFPKKYQTVLGERGVTVSGGQKQRISIARALLKEAPILILDDSVSAVDTHTERMILKNLRESRKGMTTLLIAHRISTIEQMDKVLFIDEGKLVDYGTPSELYERCPLYREMVELQQLEDSKKEANTDSKEKEGGNYA